VAVIVTRRGELPDGGTTKGGVAEALDGADSWYRQDGYVGWQGGNCLKSRRGRSGESTISVYLTEEANERGGELKERTEGRRRRRRERRRRRRDGRGGGEIIRTVRGGLVVLLESRFWFWCSAGGPRQSHVTVA
jgi:hypothetical protein